MRTVFVAAFAACALVTSFAGAQPARDEATKEIAARVELHAIPSLTLSDEQFLAGDANGKPVTVTGQLALRRGPAGSR